MLFPLLLVSTELVHIDGMLHLHALGHRWFLKFPAPSHFLDDACSLCLSLELLEGSFNVLALFYRYNNHLT